MPIVKLNQAFKTDMLPSWEHIILLATLYIIVLNQNFIFKIFAEKEW